MTDFHASLDAALARSTQSNPFVSDADDATNLGLLIFTDATPGGTDRIIKRILASDWLAARDAEVRAAERERIAADLIAAANAAPDDTGYYRGRKAGLRSAAARIAHAEVTS